MMAATPASPTRRSPRSVERICNEIILPGMTIEQTAMLFALCHCTGWSAERITNKFREATGVEIYPAQAWDFHRAWVKHRGGEDLAPEDTKVMNVLLQQAGVDISTFGPPLNRTSFPQTVKFAACWAPKLAAETPLFAGYTVEARLGSKEYLTLRPTKAAFGKLTPTECTLVAQFGGDMASIFKDVMKRWARVLFAKIRKERDLRAIPDFEYVAVIMEYLKVFQDQYESKFGKLGEGLSGPLGEIVDKLVYIRSTGYGARIFLSLMMADRVHVIESSRKRERRRVGFLDLDPSKLDEDSQDCSVCRDRLGVANPEGRMEMPIKLVICCGQVMGRQCLKHWLSQFAYSHIYRGTCPVCRFKFPQSFIQKLFTTKEYFSRTTMQAGRPPPDAASSSSSPSPPPSA